VAFFMDRHDLQGVSAADLEADHMRDLGAQAAHGVRFLSYWFDYERQAAFCLIDAPDAATAQEVHRGSHGNVAHEIIPVDPADVARFLGRTDDPATSGREAESAFRIILFTDLEGSTAMVQRLCDDALAAHGGREVKHTGDGIMASFASVRSALACATAVQRGFAEHARERPDEPMRVRIGMSAGEPVAEGDDLFGAAVQLAARLCALAEPGAVMVSAVLRDLSIGKGFAFGETVRPGLKGFPAPVEACELRWAED
jgi:class 3 adenylate cyclase